MEEFAVLLEQYQPPPQEKLSALFQAVCGLPKLDALTKAARAGGIIAEKLNGEQARNLQTALGNLKFPARVVPQATVPTTVKGRRVHWLAAEPAQLSVRWTLTGPIDFYPWSDVLVISAAVVFHQAKEQVLKTVRQSGLMGNAFGGRSVYSPANYTTEITHRDASKDMAMATITLGNSPQKLQTLRVRHTELEYGTMLAGNAGSSALQNFCLVLARIGNYATTAHLTDETIELIAAAHSSPQLPRSPRFASEVEFDQYQRWLVTRQLQA
jgi:hypothetical protein